MKKDYADAYSEVLEVLKYIPESDYKKIPIATIQLLEANSNEKSEFTYNLALPFDKQNISKDAKIILAILYRNCWIKEEDKAQLKQKEREHIKAIEKEKREKYNPNKIFENREKAIVKQLEQKHYLTVKQKWYNNIFSKIRNFFRGFSNQ